jgi:ankyrin repeat protein
MLIDWGADIEAQDSSGCTVLDIAILGGHEGTVRLLQSSGANLDSRDFGGRTVVEIDNHRERRREERYT